HTVPLPFLFNASATHVLYTLSLHDALPILYDQGEAMLQKIIQPLSIGEQRNVWVERLSSLYDSHSKHFPTHKNKNELKKVLLQRSEEHTSELQSRENLVCRLLLEKKKKKKK